MLRGFFIFLVFIFKSSVWEMIKKKHPRLSSSLSVIFVCNSARFSSSRSNLDNAELMQLEQTRQTSDTATKHHQLTHGKSFDTKVEVIATPVWKMSILNCMQWNNQKSHYGGNSTSFVHHHLVVTTKLNWCHLSKPDKHLKLWLNIPFDLRTKFWFPCMKIEHFKVYAMTQPIKLIMLALCWIDATSTNPPNIWYCD